MLVSAFPRKSQIAAAVAALALAAAVSTAHATFPGENGVIVFDNPVNSMIGRVAPTGGAPTYVLTTVLSSSGPTATISRQVRYASSWGPGFVNVTVPSALPSTTDIALTLTPSGNAQLMYTDQHGAWLQERSNPIQAASWTSAVPNTSIATGATTASISAPASGTGPSAAVFVRASAQ
ncbi:hypothetical protein [Caenimonas aquaedulcis]|uniref:Uncharacterized protein n=1 Tax=Caenimonas aquaedulcis TaxID=2793270 RepID=A0A931H1Q4_9BURK|nr:hypothetical protein [Caenimonas aquaedulcis]MBG9386933.1 hypothetical protein [Caenimonas aquaedulcis]